MKTETARQVAAKLLEKIEKNHQYANLSLDQALKQHTLSDVDRRFVTRLVYGTIQWQLRLDYNWQAFVEKPQQLPLWVVVNLRLALYQFLMLDKVPSHAIFNSATQLAKMRDHGRYAKLVNAVLRQVQRHGEQDYQKITDQNTRLSVIYSVPRWLVEILVAQYGYHRCQTLLQTINQPPHVSLRLNPEIGDVKQISQDLQDHYPQLQPSPITPVGLIAPQGHFSDTAAFAQGQYTLQDESSMLVAPSMQLQPQHHVLDACAAPGGKTTHIATYLDAKQGGQVTALDIHARKLSLIQENAQRLHVADRIKTKQLDARQAGHTFADQSFDRILVDAPCSGLGLMRRKPEIRYAKKPQAIAHLPQIQSDILRAVSPLVKIGGVLVYSTCTIIAAENEEVTARFLNEHPNFKAAKVAAAEALHWPNRYQFQILMDDDQTDGFYIACFQRTA